MYLPERRLFSQPSLVICLVFFSLLSLSTFLHLQKNNYYPWWRISIKNTSTLPDHKPTSFLNTTPGTPTKNLDRGMWTVNSIGRLGNQMGEYATLYALAKLNGHQAYILPAMHQYLAPIFKITLPVVPSELVGKIPWRNYNLHDWMSEEYRHIQGKYVRLTGYPCSFTFYDHIRQEILQEFTFHDYIKEDTNQYLLQLRGQRKEVTYIGVHVRRGDYVNVMPNVWKGVVADKDYLEKAMNYFREKYHDAIFVVVSNGMDWCKQNINASRGDVYFAGDGRESSPGRDFALIAHCNHTIMTIGTFGIWAGYLVGGETVYLANYTLPDSPFLKVFKPSAAFLPEWIGIPADLSPLLPKS
ncbi:galactoside alpha-(1,2)-fucosyltransferase 2-like [Eublepharis macularius]|uniref:L-Fucosyltransferase n=1 Tax=Eublepharis macularius TaxID=481883 RepID=A0AA97K2J9_EUBMA|nr:galactoside alpha-(1,2)-fucosyltransferase 2-like [Eublepharis macularius]XP_054848632.1 galactoside alpha-(1,2)-fucosyltransferase 2-like [Eublepharis macularius]XP_054848633.1 galactoside alpha-(1,2)-fucosyltransferase 2-like [Eublepharis macularius]XP_054848634.1 galactoside alpha-(1,2)-fucosyltransferase 2-like [Eublepharis macularius]XP_054848635.1 galactoside alpha-(1,2)-fucosyltransferase 2-like [Eublepharis macularius]XP_054848636.1 galactoside alpha-(1,2)-fucosyltransferase 2-like 